MKTKVSMREIRANYPNIIRLGYCTVQSLLCRKNPRWYTCGIYGWNADIYEINPTTVIVTGYRPFGNIQPPPYEKIREYEKRADEIVCNFKIPYDEQCRILDNMLADFIGDCFAQNVK